MGELASSVMQAFGAGRARAVLALAGVGATVVAMAFVLERPDPVMAMDIGPAAAGDGVIGEGVIMAGTDVPARRESPPMGSGEIGAVLDIFFKDSVRKREGAEEPSVSPERRRDPLDAIARREIHSRLSTLGYYRGDLAAAWGDGSKAALKRFKAANRLADDDVWDAATERALFDPSLVEQADFVGVWAPHKNACSPRSNSKGQLPATINHEGAWAGEVSCAFKNNRRVGDDWLFTAVCNGKRRRWTSNVRLSVSADRLTWKSERGAQTYVRCS